MRADRVQDLGERVRLVGIVDQHRRAARVDADPLHPPGRALEPAEQRGCGLGVGAGGEHQTERRQQIARLKRADQRGPDPVLPAIEGEGEALTVRLRPALDQAQPRGRPTVVEDGDAALPADRGERLELGLVGVEHGGSPRAAGAR